MDAIRSTLISVAVLTVALIWATCCDGKPPQAPPVRSLECECQPCNCGDSCLCLRAVCDGPAKCCCPGCQPVASKPFVRYVCNNKDCPDYGEYASFFAQNGSGRRLCVTCWADGVPEPTKAEKPGGCTCRVCECDVCNCALFGAAEPKPIRLALITATAGWCDPCNRLKPAWEQVAAQHPICETIDIDGSREWCRSIGVNSVPTLVILEGDQRLYQPWPSKVYSRAELQWMATFAEGVREKRQTIRRTK